MDSKKKTKRKRKPSYLLTLFVPTVALLWIIVIVVELTQYNRDKEFRSDMIRARIEFMNAYLLSLIEQDADPTPYFRFIDKYYEASELDELSMTVYDMETSEEIDRIGFPSPPPEQFNKKGKIDGSYLSEHNNDDSTYIHPDRMFYYKIDRSPDQRFLVQTFLPLDGRVAATIKGNPWMRIFVLLGCAAITIVTFIATRHMAKNVRLLREFVDKAVNDKDFVALDKFANDDLGEISRQVVNIYNMRKAAIASRELEHRVALKAIEERTNLKRQLTNNINHELKTPAGIVKGYIDTIIENPEMDAESRQHFMLKTQEHIERLCSILNDLSTITRLEDGAQSIALEKIDFTEFVNNLECDIEESGVNGDMSMTTKIPANCYVQGNITLLTGVLMNLVKNAVAYSKGTEMELKLLTENQKFYTFVFRDNGQGVPEESIPLLFDRFYRVDKGRSRKAGGTGLGLPIVKNSLNTIGGTISVKNGDKGGLMFVFTLLKWKDNKAEGTDGKKS